MKGKGVFGKESRGQYVTSASQDKMPTDIRGRYGRIVKKRCKCHQILSLQCNSRLIHVVTHDKISLFGASEMAQQEKVLSAKSENLSSSPRTHIIGENLYLQVDLHTSAWVWWSKHTHTH